MKFTLKEFNAQFPDDRACLDFIFQSRWKKGITCEECGHKDCFYPVEKRRSYSCSWCGFQVYPTAGTIFHKSSTSLKLWFFAMFLMTTSRNGVAAKELERHLGVTYKTAWRMAHQIRTLMGDDKPGKLKGVVEADETYIGGVRPGKRGRGAAGKTPVVGVIERGGNVHVKAVLRLTNATIFGHLWKNVEPGTVLYTDELAAYGYAGGFGLKHDTVNHGKEEYVRGDVHTNTIEGFWAQFKRSVDGTHHSISPKHLQKYLNEFAYRHNHRVSGTALFPLLAAQMGAQLSPAA
jgi:transposase